ncbi:xanthine dehydrogenase family protein molybdopterin-binding subunit [Microbacterium sediminicola]|uniref:Xanthine dehydrogenase family protein molybdopterin-binding subunit n=1 Tax=Microbacterium sediminicola TaxID=415210 RepID=A0ABP4UH32_9MICO
MTDSPWSPLDYTADLAPPDVLYAAPIPALSAGRVTAHNLSEIRGIAGVVLAVDSSADTFPMWSGVPHGGVPERRILTSHPKSAGDIVAALVADSPAALRQAVAATVVTIEPDRSAADRTVEGPRYGDAESVVRAALAAAPLSRSDTLRIGSGPNGALELPAALATWRGSCLQVTSTTQTPQPTAARLAELFALPANAVTVSPTRLGGGFGGKEEIILEPLAALLSRALEGRPVMAQLSRAHSQQLYRKHDASVTVQTGYDPSGRLIARWVDLTLECGAYLGHSPHVAANGLHAPLSLYEFTAVGGASVLHLDDSPVRAPFRGYGSAQVHAACEHQIDLIARELDIDPIEFRLRNLDANTGAAEHSLTDRTRLCLERLQHQLSTRGLDARRGVGVAVAANISSTTGGAEVDSAEARCLISPAGLVVDTGLIDMGQGILRAAAAVVAEECRIDPRLVTVTSMTTSDAPTDRGAFASRGAYVSLGAVALAARDVAAALEAHVLVEKGAPVDHLDSAGIHLRDGQLVRWSEAPSFNAHARFDAPDQAMAACAQAVVLAETTHAPPRPELVISVHDAGRVIDRSRADLQVQGGVLQGLGWALFEADEPLDDSLLRAGMATARDMPDVEVHFVEVPNPQSPIGARGLGEIPIVPTLAAVANAVFSLSDEPVRAVPLREGSSQ